MAKVCWIAREEKRRKLVERYAQTRQGLRKKQIDMRLSEQERQDARFALSGLPRDSAPGRRRNRCAVSGSPRSYLQAFGVGRVAFRTLALAAKLPGVTKSSW
ncbi:MAG: 30S ribosomal protein S14 [Myxococcota bacterium]